MPKHSGTEKEMREEITKYINQLEESLDKQTEVIEFKNKLIRHYEQRLGIFKDDEYKDTFNEYEKEKRKLDE